MSHTAACRLAQVPEHIAPSRRELFAGVASAAIPGGLTSGWEQFKQGFLLPDGRVVDTDNDHVSHSEGQAWGMLLAAIHGDAVSFHRIKSWTDANLAIRGDSLLAWRFRTRPQRGVDDMNAATDADLCHAWALLRAERRWPGQGFAGQAQRIAADILRLAVREIQGRTLLLPAPGGFTTTDAVIINPSYYVFPALDAIQAQFPNPAWRAVMAQGEALLEQARFGRWGLPPDWLVLRRPGVAPEPQRGRGDRFGDEALRVPLYLAWSGRWHAGPIAAARDFWNAHGRQAPPAWVRLSDGAMAPYPGGVGLRAIHRLIGNTAALAVSLPGRGGGRGYYQNALALLADAAQREAPPPRPAVLQGALPAAPPRNSFVR